MTYSREEMIREVQRVAAIVGGPTLTRPAFDQHAKVSGSTVVRTFGGWREALEAAGLGARYSGRRVTPKMRSQPGRIMTAEEMTAELQRVAAMVAPRTMTMEAFSDASPILNAAAVRSRFGSWAAGLRAAGLELSALGRRYTDDDYFENLLSVWTHCGRAPRYAEMNAPPSGITAGGYEHRWGTWSRARVAFLERVNSDVQASVQSAAPSPAAPRPRVASVRGLSVGLRYQVLSRDRFRCVRCGASPATDLLCRLHVDHVIPVSRGGATVADNLQTLCQDCNLGKGARHVEGGTSGP